MDRRVATNLPRRNNLARRVQGKAENVVGVLRVVPLCMCRRVVRNPDRGHVVDDLSALAEEDVVSAVVSAIT